jgi:hypothetical protein
LRGGADLAAEKGITLCYEFHGGTLTDTLESTCDLLLFLNELLSGPARRQ